MAQLLLFPFRTGNRLGVSPDMSDELTVSIEDLARRHGVTVRSIRNWVADGELDPPVIVAVPGTRLVVRRWPSSILAASDSVAARRRGRVRG